MAVDSWYITTPYTFATGNTATVTNGSAAITSSAKFNAGMVGAVIQFKDFTEFAAIVSTYTDSSHITLDRNYGGTNGTYNFYYSATKYDLGSVKRNTIQKEERQSDMIMPLQDSTGVIVTPATGAIRKVTIEGDIVDTIAAASLTEYGLEALVSGAQPISNPSLLFPYLPQRNGAGRCHRVYVSSLRAEVNVDKRNATQMIVSYVLQCTERS
jgi:hypothetical protein